MLPSKWKRAAIGAAGMYVEVIIASIATFLWWNTREGFFNQLCLDVMFVSSVSTILFNANPLLRYDGYYILSDLLEIPNLKQKSTSILSRLATKWCLGIKQPEDPFLPQRNRHLFALYAVASAAYGWLVTASIFFFVWKVLEPYRLEVLGQAMAMTALWGLVIRPITGMVKFLRVPGRMDEVKTANLSTTAAVVGGVAAAIALIPLPQRVWCAVELRPRAPETVYVTVTGRLESRAVEPGDEVEAGAELARLSNIDLELAIADLEGKADQYRSRLHSLERERFTDEAAGLEIGTVEESLASFEEQLAKKRRDQAELVRTAPRGGVVFPPPATRKEEPESDTLPGWSGQPLDRKNLGATLEQGTILCQIGLPHELEAVMLVDQSEMEFVTKGQPVDIRLDAFPWRTLRGTIDTIAETSVLTAPERLSVKAGGQVPTETDPSGRERPISTHYEVSTHVDDGHGLMTPGMRGSARIRVGSRTVGQWLLRLLWQTFNFKL
jgi:putative peptide zinc metalloprotease protein